MSILLIDPDPELGTAIAERLIAEGDELRVLVPEAGDWKQRGAFVAVGDPMDADLVERACTNVRTLVFASSSKEVPVSLLATVVPAGRKAGADRVILCTPRPDVPAIRWLEEYDGSYVTLATGRRGFLPKRTVQPERVAEAVSAADDLAGRPRLTVDLTSEDEWVKLGGHP